MERDGGVSPHTSPFLTVPDMGNMLVAAGFGLPTVDSETITVEYPDVFTLFKHLQKMGESNASYQTREGIRRPTLMAAAAAYQGLFGKADDAIPATFQLIHFIGWAPAPSQPSPLRRGSVSKGFGARGSGPPPSPAPLPSSLPA
jgi:NADH dehydrogenase [ubiquinone] 1 alpha subcomplex assembly factor 5